MNPHTRYIQHSIKCCVLTLIEFEHGQILITTMLKGICLGLVLCFILIGVQVPATIAGGRTDWR